MDKYKIEKNTVQETLVIPLYGRRLCPLMAVVQAGLGTLLGIMI